MHQKDKSVTTSSRSLTSKPASEGGCDTSIQYVKGVGPKLGAIFKNREIHTVRDLLHFFPRAYEDRSELLTVSQLTDGIKATVSVRVLSQRQIPIQKLGRSLLEVRCTDDTAPLSLKWFHAPRGMEKRLLPGAQLVVTGKVKFYMGRPEIVHPEMNWGAASAEEPEGDDPNIGRVVPIYTELDGIPTRTFRKVLWEALEKYGETISEEIPTYLLQRRGLPSLSTAIRALHFPPEEIAFGLKQLEDFSTPAHLRLIYGEFFKFEYSMVRRRIKMERTASIAFGQKGGKAQISKLSGRLPFRLTGGQSAALKDILQDLSQAHPMNRLIQGDVGAGKTVVALLSAAFVMAEGGQVALMVPTEILADQHFRSAMQLFENDFKVALLTGKSTTGERNQLQGLLSAGEPMLVIGTHALIEDGVQFSKLSYVMIDEQHRFGVEQRGKLKQKGIRPDPASGQPLIPHMLVLTATPIPRTLALTVFGDLAVSSISELPPGRSPILTKVIRDKARRNSAYNHVKKEIQAGRQAYFIYPLVNDSEAEGFTQLKSAISEANLLAREVFPEFSVGLLHGQMSNDEKEKIMQEFKSGKVQILVSTTVVEVGVDVPNATIMAIEHAERFGLSQLHQLRGRVGRGKFQSYCFLFSNQMLSETTANRLEVLEQTNDGFKIAEADLEIRGPGEFLGTRQAGVLPFRLANLVRDRDWLMHARNDALEILQKDPNLYALEHESLRNYFLRLEKRVSD